MNESSPAEAWTEIGRRLHDRLAERDLNIRADYPSDLLYVGHLTSQQCAAIVESLDEVRLALFTQGAELDTEAIEGLCRFADTCVRALIGEKAPYDKSPVVALHDATNHELGPHNQYAALRMAVHMLMETWPTAELMRMMGWIRTSLDDERLTVDERCSFAEVLSRINPPGARGFVMSHLVWSPGLLYKAAGRVALAEDLGVLIELRDTAGDADERRWYASALKAASKRLKMSK